jgi:hypothetical protein
MNHEAKDVVGSLAFIAVISAYMTWCFRAGEVFIVPTWQLVRRTKEPTGFWTGISVLAVLDLIFFLVLLRILDLLPPAN